MEQQPYYVRIVNDMQEMLEEEEDEKNQALSIMLLWASFALKCAEEDCVEARTIINLMHEKTLNMLFTFEAKAKKQATPP